MDWTELLMAMLPTKQQQKTIASPLQKESWTGTVFRFLEFLHFRSRMVWPRRLVHEA